MCGIFGYVATEHGKPDMYRLEELAIVTSTRGDDAFGLAWMDSKGGIGHFKRPGSALENLDALELVKDAVAIIGHCRYATKGNPWNNDNNHPHVSGEGFLVHNGTVPDHVTLAKRRRIALETECDSELLAKMVARGRGTLEARARKAFHVTPAPMALLGIYPDERQMLVARRTKPLHFGKDGTGLYLASLAIGLPGAVKRVLEGYVGVLAI
jgi:glucosamine 6-phosphate synthetase-like amidotransferase/phosphosugar isomerase protein